jgi:hypothetical protein
MAMRGVHTRLTALLAAVLLLSPASAFAETIYRCRMSGNVGPRCCCSQADDRAQASPCQPEVDRPDCCEAERQTGPAAPASNVERLPSVGPAVLSATLTIEELALLCGTTPTAPARARGPPAIGPPAYIENCSLLR